MTSEEAVKRLLGTGLRYMTDRGTRIKDISVETGLSSSTIRKLMNEETEYPRFHTVWAVLEYLGYEVTIKTTMKGQSRGLRSQHVAH
jgi:DNA-binding phage protein